MFRVSVLYLNLAYFIVDEFVVYVFRVSVLYNLEYFIVDEFVVFVFRICVLCLNLGYFIVDEFVVDVFIVYVLCLNLAYFIVGVSRLCKKGTLFLPWGILVYGASPLLYEQIRIPWVM